MPSIGEKSRVTRVIILRTWPFSREFVAFISLKTAPTSDLREVLSRLASRNPSPNRIEEYQARYGRLPVLPKPVQRLGGSVDQPVSKDSVTYYANIRHWNEIESIPGLEKKWREYLEWKGEDPDEYEHKVRSLGLPKGNPHPLVYKHQPRP